MKKFLLFVVGFFVFVWIVNLCSRPDEVKKVVEVEMGDAVPEPAAPAESETSKNWSYEETTDKMTSKKSYFASTQSTNEVQFEFPYNGGSVFTLTVRKMSGRPGVVLSISKGQFISSYGETNSVKVKFDDGSPISFSYGMAADGSHDMIFIENTSKFISKLKRAKKLLIGAEFYQAGTQYAEFDVNGLEWSH